MSHKSSQQRIEADRRNAQTSTGPRAVEGEAKSASNSTIHGFGSLNMNPLAPPGLLPAPRRRKSIPWLTKRI